MSADVLFGMATVAVAAALVWGLLCDSGHENDGLTREVKRRGH